mmetsp:Transcript_18393/g.21216  ORF Transcript_18393/g.21216 Transcript_18393/m.21216 type:complete len:92 (+) Transcript_18393:67-342(+)
MTVAINTVRTVATRVGSKRAMSSAGPRMHKAKDAWSELQTTRPPEGHPHNVFEPPYNKATAALGVLSVLGLGYGTMYFGLSHQQRKQGYWK